MTPQELKSWRKARALTQTEAAKRVNITLRTWQRYEMGESDIPDSLIAYCDQAGEEAPPSDEHRIGGGAPAAPQSEAELVAAALHHAQQYIDGMAALPDKYGSTMPYKFAVSYWFDGAMVMPLVFYGQKGVTPCAAAYKAATAKLQQAYQDGALWRMLARLDECPVHIKQRV